MDRYSFFSFTAVFCDYSFQSSIFNDYCSIRTSVVYADESITVSDYNSDFDSVDSSLIQDYENLVEQEEYGSVFNESEIENNENEEIYSQESNLRSLTRAGFPASNWGFNYQNDPQTIPTTSFPAFMNWFPAYIRNQNQFIDIVAGRLNEYANKFSTINNRFDALIAVDADLYAQLGGFIKKANARFDALVNIDKDLYSQLGGFINKANGRFDALIAVDNDQYAQIRNVNGRADALVNVDKDIYKQLSASITDSKNKFDALIKVDNDQYAQIRNVNTRADALVNADKDIYKQLSNSIADSKSKFEAIVKVDNDQYAQIRNVNGRADELVKADNDLYAQLFATNLKIDSLSFDSSGIIKAINDMSKLTNANILLNTHATDVVRDSVNALNDSYKDSIFGDISSVEGGINRNDGDLTKMIKGQFSRLIKENEKIFFTDGKVAENEKDGYLVKLLKSLVYSMRYSMISEFADFTEIFKHEMLLNRNNVSEYILLLNKNFETVNGWLKLIYEKKLVVDIPPISIVPGEPFIFDYDLLQKMFDGISFGEITNEAGKNIWDFLGELVKALADVVKALSDLVSKIMQMLIDVFVPSDVSFITDELSKLSSLFTKKFSFAIELKDFFTSMFEVAQVDFNTNLEFSANGSSKSYDISFIMPFISAFRAPLTALIVISNLFYCYKRVIGQGDVIA